MKARYLIIIMLMAMLGFVNLVQTQTLDEFQKKAMKSNPALQAAQETWKASKEQAIQQGWWPNPKLKFSMLNLPAGELAFDRTPMSGKQIMVMQKVPFWKSPIKGARASAQADASYQAWQEMRWEMRARVTDTFHNINYLQKADKILKRNLDLLKHLVKVARVKYEGGVALEQDVLRAEVEYTILENQLLEIKQKLVSGLAKLRALVGAANDVSIKTVDMDKWQAIPFNRIDLHRVAKQKNAKLKKLEYQLKQIQLNRRLADEDWIPDLELSGYYTLRAEVKGDPVQGEDFIGAAAGIEIPLWFFSQELPASREAKARLESAKNSFTDWKNHLESKVTDSIEKLEQLKKSQNLYAQKVLPQAKAALDSSLTAYQTGKVEFLTLINNETMLVMHELKYWRIIADYEIEIARLEALVGETFTQSTKEELP